MRKQRAQAHAETGAIMTKSQVVKTVAVLAILALVGGLVIYWQTPIPSSDRQQILDMLLAVQERECHEQNQTSNRTQTGRTATAV